MCIGNEPKKFRGKFERGNQIVKIVKTKQRQILTLPLKCKPCCPDILCPPLSLCPPHDLHFSLIFATLPLKIIYHGLFKFAISSIVTIMTVYLSLASSKFRFRSNRSGDCESLSNPAKHGSPNFGAQLHLALYILLVDSLSPYF